MWRGTPLAQAIPIGWHPTRCLTVTDRLFRRSWMQVPALLEKPSPKNLLTAWSVKTSITAPLSTPTTRIASRGDRAPGLRYQRLQVCVILRSEQTPQARCACPPVFVVFGGFGLAMAHCPAKALCRWRPVLMCQVGCLKMLTTWCKWVRWSCQLIRSLPRPIA